jgi:hypothetical protein
MPEPADAADPIEAAWQRVEAQWNDPEAHRAFLGLCLALDRMPEAGRRYRQVRDTDPQRRAEAERRIDELLAMATQRLELARTPARTETNRRRLFWIAFLVSLGMVVLVLWAILRGI